MGTQSSANEAKQAREKYVNAFNATMVKMWREQITLLGVIDTGALYRSIRPFKKKVNPEITEVELGQTFNMYGMYVDAGTGSNTPRGNPGDIGRENKRKRTHWFRRKFARSFYNIQEFFAENLGQQACLVISNALDPDSLR